MRHHWAVDPTVVRAGLAAVAGPIAVRADRTGRRTASTGRLAYPAADPTAVQAGLAAAADPTEVQGQVAEQVPGERTRDPTVGEQEHIPAGHSRLPAAGAEAVPTVAVQPLVAGQEAARSSVAGFAWSAAGAEAVPIAVAAVAAAWGLRRTAVADPTAGELARAAARPSACNRAEAAVRTALVPEQVQAWEPVAGPAALAQAGTAEAV